MRICDKCQSYSNVEEHHLWPKFMNNPHGFAYPGFISRIWLCKDCHIKILHNTIIIPILKKYSIKNDYNSESALWIFIPQLFEEEVIRDVVYSTKYWVEKDGDTKTTAS
jgi:hypothetical protein